MSHIAVFLILSSVFAFGFCYSVPKTKHVLEDEIKHVKEETAKVNKENKFLQTEIKIESDLYHKKVKLNDNIKKMGTAENQHLKSVLEDLYQKVTRLHIEEHQLKERHENVEKLKLGVRVTEANIKLLEERRANGMTKLCLHLENMADKDRHAKASFLTSGRVEDTIVLENELRLARSELEEAKGVKAELKLIIEALRTFYVMQSKQLHDAIDRNGEDMKKLEESIDKVKKSLAEQQKVIDEIIRKSGTAEKELEQWKKEAKKVLDKFNRYTLDVLCFRRLKADVMGLLPVW